MRERERELCISSWSREDLKGFRMTPNLPYLYLFTLYLYALFFYLCAISSLRSGFLSLYYIISEIWISISVLYHLWDLVFYCYTISYLRSGFLSLYYISGLFFYLCTISLLWFYISTLHLRSSFQFMYYIISVWLSVSVLTICPLFLFLCPGPLCMSMMTFHL